MPGPEIGGFDELQFRLDNPETAPEIHVEPGEQPTDAEAAYVAGILGPAETRREETYRAWAADLGWPWVRQLDSSRPVKL